MFIHLHNHSIYSMKDGMAEPLEYLEEIVKRTENDADNTERAFALTEHGFYNSYVKLYKAAKECKKRTGIYIKPIYGFEAYMCRDATKPSTDKSPENKERYHLVLLAKNKKGHQNLLKLATLAGTHIYKPSKKPFPRLDHNMLKGNTEGIICLSACVQGLIPHHILKGNIEKAKRVINFYKTLFDDFYLEVQPHEIPEQITVNNALIKLSKELNVPLVMTCDAHYINASDKIYHNILNSIDHYKELSVNSYLRTEQELIDYCDKYNIPKECISNTVKINEMIEDIELKPDNPEGLLPTFPLPTGYTDSGEYLREVTMKGFFVKSKKKKSKDISKRLKQLQYELDIICSKGFADYFLILWDWFNWCRKNDIPMGPGRGSSAGSLVAYYLNITKVDPIKNGFIFERFLTEKRNEMPDIDSDVSKKNRARAIKYLEQKYGTEYVSQIMTVAKYKLASIIKAAMTVSGLPFDEGNAVTKLIPTKLADETNVTYDLIQKCVNDPDKYEIKTRELKTLQELNEKMSELFKKYPKVYDIVNHLLGCVSGFGCHAGGVLLASDKLTEYMPMMNLSKSAVLQVTQIDMEDVHDPFNGLKIDVLGLSQMDKLYDAMKLAGLDWDWYDSEDYSDPKVYKTLRDGYTKEVFQMGSSAATRMLFNIKIERFEEGVIINAGNRPGPLAKNKDTGKSMMDLIFEAKKTGKNYSFGDERIDSLLTKTYGVPLYQEDLMKIACKMAGYDLGGSDERIRKPIAKKKHKMFPEIRNEFVYGKKSLFDKNGNVIGKSEENSNYCIGAINNGYTEKFANKMFDIFVAFGSYAFNRSHSGCYFVNAYKSGWLLTYYPVEYTIACASDESDNDKVTDVLIQAKKMGIEFLPPDINKSFLTFTIDYNDKKEKAIRFSLLKVKHVGEKVVNFIVNVRNKYGDYKDFDDFYSKMHNSVLHKEFNCNTSINKTHETSLIKVGAFDFCEPNRNKLLNHYFIDLRKEKKYEMLNEKFLRKDKLAYEKELLDFYASEHPLDPFPYTNITSDTEAVVTTGMVKSFTSKKTKRGKKFGSVSFEAKDGKTYKGQLFGKAYEEYHLKCKKDAIIVVYGDWNNTWQNINVSKIRKIVSKSEIQSNSDLEIDDEVPLED